MINEKKVSVIIPTYKRAELLSKCIKSILEQTYSNVEVIVVDDNDPKTNWRKNTESILNDFKEDSRVIYIKHEKNKNGSAARNTGFKVSTGEYICYLDDDDIFLKNKIMKQVECLEAFKDMDACCCDYSKEGKKYILPDKVDYTEDILLSNDTPQTSGIMFRRTCIECLKGFDESYIRHQDYELLLRFFEKGFLMKKVNEILYVRERADNNNLPNGEKMEKVKKKFLLQFETIINKIDNQKKGFKQKVYVVNYFSVMKCYIKDRKFGKAISIMLKCLKVSPSIFLKETINCIGASINYRCHRFLLNARKKL